LTRKTSRYSQPAKADKDVFGNKGLAITINFDLGVHKNYIESLSYDGEHLLEMPAKVEKDDETLYGYTVTGTNKVTLSEEFIKWLQTAKTDSEITVNFAGGKPQVLIVTALNPEDVESIDFKDPPTRVRQGKSHTFNFIFNGGESAGGGNLNAQSLKFIVEGGGAIDEYGKYSVGRDVPTGTVITLTARYEENPSVESIKITFTIARGNAFLGFIEENVLWLSIGGGVVVLSVIAFVAIRVRRGFRN